MIEKPPLADLSHLRPSQTLIAPLYFHFHFYFPISNSFWYTEQRCFGNCGNTFPREKKRNIIVILFPSDLKAGMLFAFIYRQLVMDVSLVLHHTRFVVWRNYLASILATQDSIGCDQFARWSRGDQACSGLLSILHDFRNSGCTWLLLLCYFQAIHSSASYWTEDTKLSSSVLLFKWKFAEGIMLSNYCVLDIYLFYVFVWAIVLLVS